MSAFTLGEVARICGVRTARLRYWQRTRLLGAEGPERQRAVYEFGDLVSVRTLLSLLEQGVSLASIRRSVDRVRERAPEVERPLGALRPSALRAGALVLRRGGRLEEPGGQLLLELGAPGSARVAQLAPAGRAAVDDPGGEAARWFDRGCTLDGERRTFAEAIEAYERALAADPNFADAHCNLGTIYYNQNRRALARRCFERALELEPLHMEAHLNLATLFEEEGDGLAALRHLKQALRVDPLCTDTHVGLALLYERLDLRHRARAHWRRVLGLDPGGPWADVARRHLDA